MGYRVDTVELQKIMAEKKIKNIEEFARKSGINRNTLSDVIKGKIRPSTSVMDRIVIALELAPEMAGRIFLLETYELRKIKSVRD